MAIDRRSHHQVRLLTLLLVFSSRRLFIPLFLSTLLLHSISLVSSVALTRNHNHQHPHPSFFISFASRTTAAIATVSSATSANPSDLNTATTTTSSSSSKISTANTNSTEESRESTLPLVAASEKKNKQHHKMTIILGVRHATSTANEYMDRPGNQWGDATFFDDVSFQDAPLSTKGQEQVQQLAVSFLETMQSLLLLEQRDGQEEELSKLDEQQDQLEEQDPKAFRNSNSMHPPAKVELVVISPLTRCLETWLHGVRPGLRDTACTVPCIVLPLAAERVYTSSDTGGRQSLSELQAVFSQPELDWSYMTGRETTDTTTTNPPDKESPPWWYTGDTNVDTDTNPPPSNAAAASATDNENKNSQQQEDEQSLLEWRPHGQGQYYACAGEPEHVFGERMRQLSTWLRQRPEKCIVLVTHWGVLRYLGEPDVRNCGVVRMEIQ